MHGHADDIEVLLLGEAECFPAGLGPGDLERAILQDMAKYRLVQRIGLYNQGMHR